MLLKESEKQSKIANYFTYLQLKEINYSDDDICNHLSCSNQQLKKLILSFK